VLTALEFGRKQQQHNTQHSTTTSAIYEQHMAGRAGTPQTQATNTSHKHKPQTHLKASHHAPACAAGCDFQFEAVSPFA